MIHLNMNRCHLQISYLINKEEINKENLPVVQSTFFDVCKGILGFLKNLIIKIFGD